MKLLLENWRKYLLKEQSELWNYKIQPEQKIFVSSKPYSSFRNVQQEKPVHAMSKPQGLWYGCGDSWLDWAKGEMPHMIEKTNYLYEVRLGEEILQISNDNEFSDFQSFYGFTSQFHQTAIDWEKIQSEGYHGVEICPYLLGKRSEDWYYPWDVASGCIWNSAGISDIILLAERGDERVNETPI